MKTMDAAWQEQEPSESLLAELDEAEVHADPFGALASLVDFRTLSAAILPDAGTMAGLGLSVDGMSYMRCCVSAVVKSARMPLLMRAMFLIAVGLLEPLITRLVQLLLFEDTSRGYKSLADARLENKARRLCFGSPANWRMALVEEFGIAPLDRLVDWDRLGRLWEDRDVLIHRGGVADARHSRKTGSVAVTVIEIDADGVRAVIDEIGAARFGLVAGVWNKITPGSGAMAESAAGMIMLRPTLGRGQAE